MNCFWKLWLLQEADMKILMIQQLTQLIPQKGTVQICLHSRYMGNGEGRDRQTNTHFDTNCYSFRWEYKLRSSLCTHAIQRTDSKDLDIYVLDRWMPTTKTHPACTIHKDGMWLPLWSDYNKQTKKKKKKEICKKSHQKWWTPEI